MRLTNRTLQLTASPIAEAHAWLAHRTSDRELLDMSQAAPGYPTAPEIAARIAAVAAEADGGRYAPPPGLPLLNDAFGAELSTDYGAGIDPGRILPTGGCNQAFCVTTSTLTEPGDEIILPVPYYFNHDMWLKLDGVTPRYLFPDATLIPDPARAASLINDRTRAIVLVTPGNPTGVTVPPDTIRAFYELAAERDIALIVDETYRNFRLTDDPPHDLFAEPRWDETVISLHSFSKDLAIPGYRVGAIVAGEALLYEIMKMVDCVQISAPRIGQEAALAGLQHARAWRSEQAARINRALARYQEVMAAEPGGFRLATAGAFFGWARHPFVDLATDEVIKRLVLDHDVLAIPGTAFTPQDDRWVRFSYANLDLDQFDVLADRLNEMSA
ncbi:MAG: aminotransferase [Acidimicrobiales bacterium]